MTDIGECCDSDIGECCDSDIGECCDSDIGECCDSDDGECCDSDDGSYLIVIRTAMNIEQIGSDIIHPITITQSTIITTLSSQPSLHTITKHVYSR